MTRMVPCYAATNTLAKDKRNEQRNDEVMMWKNHELKVMLSLVTCDWISWFIQWFYSLIY